jgi:Domain of unknown function (DUF4337)
MSDEEFHVHGAHEHHIEHAAHAGEGLAQWVAIFTALLSTLGAVISYQSGATQNEAMLYKNEAVLYKTRASDQWNFYQAKSMKGHLMEMAADLAPVDKREHYRQQVAKYDREKAEIRAKAEQLEKTSAEANVHSIHTLHPHHRQAQAMTLIQIAISLASITALTRKRWLFGFAGIAAVAGVGLWAAALLA